MTFIPAGRAFQGSFSLGGDKSISHRLVLLSIINQGSFIIENLSQCRDVQTSLKIFRQLGGKVRELSENCLELSGPGRCHAGQTLDCENSGTTARLLCGILAGMPGWFKLTGDDSLQKRPMQRVCEPLSKMGAEFSGNQLPFFVHGKSALVPLVYESPTASAQVKSAIILAGSYAQGTTILQEPFPSRDHTERLLQRLGAAIEFEPGRVMLKGPWQPKVDCQFKIPGDISSAAFVIAAAILIPGAKITCQDVLLNPGRTAFLNCLKRMGAKVDWQVESDEFEPIGQIRAEFSPGLQAIDICAEEIPALIDELPVLSAVMARAAGVSTVSGAEELRVKESDRISALCSCFKQLGIVINEKNDGYSIKGQKETFFEGTVDPGQDHRIAATMLVMALTAKHGFRIGNLDCIDISFPEFRRILSAFSATQA
jgi:3-phosphoshikimate 1-carboxyvinyltransferase